MSDKQSSGQAGGDDVKLLDKMREENERLKYRIKILERALNETNETK